ncbi:MAG: polysaccharide biosynthesis C-terminal domain-containing protein [Bacteroidetes bacterium]|nr:polysaccharide biosynthesis C-terminal domain-containing protein [Bacteroidota bacterium]
MAEGKGIYSIFQSDIDLLTLFLGFTISSAIVFYVSNNKINLEKLVGIGISFIAIGALILTFLFFIIPLFFNNNFLFPKNHNSLFHHIYLLITFCVVMSITVLSSVFQGKSQFKVLNFITIFNSIINLIVYGILFYLKEFKNYNISINFILIVTASVHTLNLTLWLLFYKKYINIVPRFNFSYESEIKPLFIFITIGHIAHMVNFLTYKMDFWIVEHYNGSKELGYYSQAVGFSQMFWSITNPIIIVLTPYLTSKTNENAIESFKFFSRVNFTLIFILVLIAFSICGFIFPLYGQEFEHSVIPFRILSLSIIMSCITKIFAVYIYANNKIVYNLIAASVAFVTTLAADLILIPRYGMMGASIATTISYTTLTAMVSYFLFFKMKVDHKNLFFLKTSDYSAIFNRLKTSLVQSKNEK